MHLFVIEALPFDAPESFIRKWISSHRRHPRITPAIQSCQLFRCATAESFIEKIRQFIQWQRDIILLSRYDIVVLCLSAHGLAEDEERRLPRGRGMRFQSGEEAWMLDTIGLLSRELRPEVAMIQSLCWGGLPGIARAMNSPAHGPFLVLGPTIAAKAAALHRAEHMTLKFLSKYARPSQAEIGAHINEVNAYGARADKGHEQFYRAWHYSPNGKLVSVPGPTLFKKIRRAS